MGMIKSELVARLAERYPHLYHRDVERIVSTVLDEISGALAAGDRVVVDNLLKIRAGVPVAPPAPDAAKAGDAKPAGAKGADSKSAGAASK